MHDKQMLPSEDVYLLHREQIVNLVLDKVIWIKPKWWHSIFFKLSSVEELSCFLEMESTLFLPSKFTIDTWKSSHNAELWEFSSNCNIYQQKYLEKNTKICTKKRTCTCKSCRSRESWAKISTFHSWEFKRPISLLTKLRMDNDGEIQSTTSGIADFFMSVNFRLRNKPPLSAN